MQRVMLRDRPFDPTDTGASPSGKASAFDADIRWFESSRPCHFLISGRGIRKALLETIRRIVLTAVAFPQKSESSLPCQNII